MSPFAEDLVWAVAVGIVAAAAVSVRPQGRFVVPLAGVAAALALWSTGRAPFLLVLAVSCAALAQVVTGGALRLAALAAGAVLLGQSVDGPEGLPSGVLAVALAVGLGWAWPHLVESLGWPASTAVLVVSVAGVWAAVPDTENIVLAAVAVLPATVAAGLGRGHVRAPSVWSLMAVLAWAAVQSERGRPGAVVGAAACLGLVVALAGVVHARRPAALAVVALVIIQAGAVLLASRVAGLETSARAAASVAMPTMLGAVGLELVVVRASGDLGDGRSRPPSLQ